MKVYVPGKGPIAVYPTGGNSVNAPGIGVVDINKHGYPGPWIAPTWTRDPATGLWTCTPVEGAEKVSNGEFTVNTDGWSNAQNAIPTRRDFTVAPDIDPTGGIDDYGLEVAHLAAGSAAIVRGTIILPSNSWFIERFKAYSPSINTKVNASFIYVRDGSYNEVVGAGNIYASTTVEDTWQSFLGTARNAAANLRIDLQCDGANVGDVAYYDAISVKIMPPPSLIALRNMGRSTLASWGAPVVVPAGYLNGVIGWASPDYLYGVYAWHNRTKVVLEKCVNGTYTVLVNTAAAYADGRLPTIVREDSTHFHVKYNGVQVGATQEITDATIINNTYFGLFSTGGGTVGDPVYAYA